VARSGQRDSAGTSRGGPLSVPRRCARGDRGSIIEITIRGAHDTSLSFRMMPPTLLKYSEVGECEWHAAVNGTRQGHQGVALCLCRAAVHGATGEASLK